MDQFRITVAIDGREFTLPPDVDVESITARITEQVRSGGGFVDLIRAPGRRLSVLVSPGMNLSIEVASSDDAHPIMETDVDQAWLSPMDLF